MIAITTRHAQAFNMRKEAVMKYSLIKWTDGEVGPGEPAGIEAEFEFSDSTFSRALTAVSWITLDATGDPMYGKTHVMPIRRARKFWKYLLKKGFQTPSSIKWRELAVRPAIKWRDLQ